MERALAVFSYDEAFSRNVGWVTPAEQQQLRRKRIAIAGLGGVGGSYLLTLARLGVENFCIADFDVFELPNLNRQAGATISNLGRPKIDVLSEMASDLNSSVDIRGFPDGITDRNVEKFFDGCDLYLDGLDFFAFDARQRTFAACARLAIPAVTVAPLGMGAALVNFLPGRMTFEEYFRWEGCGEDEMAVRFLVGLAPAFLHRGYLVEPSAVDLAGRKGPSTPMACQLCAGIAATEALKILLGRGRVYAAPWSIQFDAYSNRLVRTRRRFGNRHPMQRAAIAIARRQFLRKKGFRARSPTP